MATTDVIGGEGSSSSSSSSKSRRKAIWYSQPLTPLMEGPAPQFQDQEPNKKDSVSNWEFFRDWFKIQRNLPSLPPSTSFTNSSSNVPNSKYSLDLKLLLGVLACPLAPIPLHSAPHPHFPRDDADTPLVSVRISSPTILLNLRGFIFCFDSRKRLWLITLYNNTWLPPDVSNSKSVPRTCTPPEASR